MAMENAAELRAKGVTDKETIEESNEQFDGTPWISLNRSLLKEPEAITEQQRSEPTQDSRYLPMIFGTEIDRCEIIYSKDPDLRSKKIAQIEVSPNNSGDERNVWRHGEMTVWAETRNIVPAEPRPSVCQY